MHYIRAGVVSYSPCFFMKIMKVMSDENNSIIILYFDKVLE